MTVTLHQNVRPRSGDKSTTHIMRERSIHATRIGVMTIRR